jgi:hypothetical protein
MKHLSPPTKLFIGIILAALLLTYAALSLARYQKGLLTDTGQTKPVAQPRPEPTEPADPNRHVDTSNWKTYKDETYPLTFKYPDNWVIQSSTATPNYYDIVLNPPGTSSNIHIYISNYSYLAFEGLKQTPYKNGRLSGIKIDDSLIGAKSGEYYYTFDATMNPGQLPEFKALLESVMFE